MPVQVVDLFCGIGGLTRGLINSGLDVVAGFDNDPTCEFAYTKIIMYIFIREILEMLLVKI